MAHPLLLLRDKLLLRRRSLVETTFDQLKHLLQIQHSRHRSPANFAANLLAALGAYCHQSTKPSIYRGDDRNCGRLSRTDITIDIYA